MRKNSTLFFWLKTSDQNIKRAFIYLFLFHADVGQHYDFEKTRVINFVPPEKLKEIIDLSLPAEGCGLTPDLKGNQEESLIVRVCV